MYVQLLASGNVNSGQANRRNNQNNNSQHHNRHGTSKHFGAGPRGGGGRGGGTGQQRTFRNQSPTRIIERSNNAESPDQDNIKPDDLWDSPAQPGVNETRAEGAFSSDGTFIKVSDAFIKK